MTRQEIEAMCASVARTLQQAIRESGEGGNVGFCLLMFDFGEGPEGSFSYAANAVRSDVVKLLKEAAEKVGNEAQ